MVWKQSVLCLWKKVTVLKIIVLWRRRCYYLNMIWFLLVARRTRAQLRVSNPYHTYFHWRRTVRTFSSIIRARLADCFQLINASKPVNDVLMKQFLALGIFKLKRVVANSIFWWLKEFFFVLFTRLIKASQLLGNDYNLRQSIESIIIIIQCWKYHRSFIYSES